MAQLKIKIVDGFVWFVVTDKAKEVFESGLFEMYALYDDGSEGLIASKEALSLALGVGLDVAVEGGFINT